MVTNNSNNSTTTNPNDPNYVEPTGVHVRGDADNYGTGNGNTGDDGHPVGTAAGGLGGAALGAAIGAAGGPLGAVVGGTIGAVVGGAAGNAMSESVDSTAEDTYWRDNYQNQSYYNKDYSYDRDYQPAYAYGYSNRGRFKNETRFEDVENDLSRSWNENRGQSQLSWDDARHAARDAWYRLDSNATTQVNNR